MLSARAGEEATVEGLEAGADDYLVKPFSARELLARVRANLELDRVRRTRRELERSQALLDQAQRLARVGSWELDLATGGSGVRRARPPAAARRRDDLAESGFGACSPTRSIPTTGSGCGARGRGGGRASRSTSSPGSSPDGESGSTASSPRSRRDDQGRPRPAARHHQDITAQREAEAALAAASAAREAAVREHRIANELQASLLPQPTFDPDPLRVATYYRAGVEGTQVGGDWYDVIELGAGRTALVHRRRHGPGVQAAAVMGQLRAAVRAYARLDLPPADVLEYLDGAGPRARRGPDRHLRLRRLRPGRPHAHVRERRSPAAAVAAARRGDCGPRRCREPPLGTVPARLARRGLTLPPGTCSRCTPTAWWSAGPATSTPASTRSRRRARRGAARSTTTLRSRLVGALLPDGPDDDVALLLAEVEVGFYAGATVHQVPHGAGGPRSGSGITAGADGWAIPPPVIDDVELLLSELTTNALLHQPAGGGTAPGPAAHRPRGARPGADCRGGSGPTRTTNTAGACSSSR